MVHRKKDAEGGGDHDEILPLPAGKALDDHHQLEDRQVAQGLGRAERPLGHTQAHGLLPLLLVTDGVELQGHTAQVDDVPGLDGHGVLHRLAVDPGAVLGLKGLELPVPLVIPQKGDMASGDRGEVQDHVGEAPSAHSVFPMAQVQLGAVVHGQPAPDLLAGLFPDQGEDAADNDDEGHHHCQHPQNAAGHRQDGVQDRKDHMLGLGGDGRLHLGRQLGEDQLQTCPKFLHGYLLSPAESRRKRDDLKYELVLYQQIVNKTSQSFRFPGLASPLINPRKTI